MNNSIDNELVNCMSRDFAIRLSKLRMQKGVSARDMSLSIGQNPGYINGIENGKSMPSMTTFFFICEYLEISPAEFFSTEQNNPQMIKRIMNYLQRLDDKKLGHICDLLNDFSK